jgi:putative tricarboxylic transport membrane protein
MLSDGNFMEFFTKPISGAFLAISVAAILWHVAQALRAKRPISGRAQAR